MGRGTSSEASFSLSELAAICSSRTALERGLCRVILTNEILLVLLRIQTIYQSYKSLRARRSSLPVSYLFARTLFDYYQPLLTFLHRIIWIPLQHQRLLSLLLSFIQFCLIDYLNYGNSFCNVATIFLLNNLFLFISINNVKHFSKVIIFHRRYN